VSDYEDVLKKYEEDATNLLTKVAKLEVSHHEQLLFELVCKSAARLAKNYITAALTRAKIANPDFKIDKDVLAWRVARDYCHDYIRDDRLKTLKIDSSVDLMVAFDKVRQTVSVHECQNTFDEPAEGSQDEEDEDLLHAKAEYRQIYGFAKFKVGSVTANLEKGYSIN
jgi:predicted unusual protein kinase regulating ubiquinone biosynthesis (AarF/ABC1/UbiB family)